MTGPNFTADRNMPEAMPFSLAGNQLLIVVVMLMGSGPSARPRPKRYNFSAISEPAVPTRPVKTEVMTIAVGRIRLTPKRLKARPAGI
ncbi:hypothetical protein D3C77_726450 [compost metagenome]